MTSRKIENILANEEEIIPTSGFLASVMDRIQDEAAAPPPIPFPWKRAVPGIVLAAGGLGWSAWEFGRSVAATAVPISLPAIPIHTLSASVQTLNGRLLEQAGWVAIALAASLVSWWLSRRLAGGQR